MAEVIWTEPALEDLDALAEYIALDKPEPASDLVRRVFAHVELLGAQPGLGPIIPELALYGVEIHPKRESGRLVPRAVGSTLVDCRGNLSGCFPHPAPRGLDNMAKWSRLSGSVSVR